MKKYKDILKHLGLLITSDELDYLEDEEKIKKLETRDRKRAEFLKDVKAVQKKFSEIGLSMLEIKKADAQEVCFNRVDIHGINQCLHIASSFVLLGSESQILTDLIQNIKSREDENNLVTDPEEIDPTTIISIAALYHLLDSFKGKSEGIDMIKHRFETINWMVGSRGREDLEI